jgi:hypothetical protein
VKVFDPGAEIQLSTEGDVVQLEHRLLALDSDNSNSRFRFISGPISKIQKPGASTSESSSGQAVVSFDTFRILSEHGVSEGLLPLHFFRPFSLGNLGLELLPSGAGPGSALLRVEKKSDSMLYAHKWSRRKSHAFQHIYTKPSETLLLNLESDPFLQHDESSFRKELERLISVTEKVTKTGATVILSTPSFGMAQHIGYHLHKAQIQSVWDKDLFSTAKGVRGLLPSSEVPLWLRNLTALRKSSSVQSKNSALETKGIVYLVSKERLNNPKASRPSAAENAVFSKGVFFWVGSEIPRGFLGSGSQKWPFTENFTLANQPNLSDISELILQVKPKHTLLYGENAEATAQWLRRKNQPAQVFQASHNETLF